MNLIKFYSQQKRHSFRQRNYLLLSLLFLTIFYQDAFSQHNDTIILKDKNQYIVTTLNKNGKLDGKYSIYNDWDELIEEGEYNNGKKNGKGFLYIHYDGVECFDCADSILYKEFKNSSCVIRQTLKYKNGILDGETWYQLGNFDYKGKFKNEHDICYGYYENGLKDGEWTIHNVVNEKSNYGEMIGKVNFNKGIKIEPAIINREINFNGLILPYPSFLDSITIRERYGNRVFGTGAYKSGVKVGKWNYYTGGGDLKSEVIYDSDGKIISEVKFKTTAIVINDMKLENIKFLDVNADSTHLLLVGKGVKGKLKFWIFNLRDLSLLKSGKIVADYTSGVNFHNGDEKFLCIYSFMSGLSSILDINSMEIIETTEGSCEKFYDIFYSVKNDLKIYFDYKSISELNIQEPEWTTFQDINAFLHSVLINNTYLDNQFLSNVNLKTGEIEFKEVNSNKEYKKLEDQEIKNRSAFLNQALIDNINKFSLTDHTFESLEFYSIKEGDTIVNYKEFKETESDYFNQNTLLFVGSEFKKINFAYENKVVYYDYYESNGYLVFWNGNLKDKNKRAVRLNIKKDKSYIFYSSDLYYMFKGNINKDLFFEQDLKLFPFEQFDLKYNRPDIILERLGYADSLTIATYHSAYKKRLKKMNFTEEMLQNDFHLPEIKINNLTSIPLRTKLSELSLDLSVSDSKYPLDRINIFINDVPVYGTNGIDLRAENKTNIEKKISLELSDGQNKIQVSVLNQAGAESYKETVYTNYEPDTSIKPDLFLITIGDSKYSDARYDLTYASKDATDIKNAFEKNSNSIYGAVHTFTYIDEQVTKENILKLKSELLKAKRDDVVMITVAGHGVLDNDFNYYLATHDMDFSNPKEKGLPYEDLESLLDGIAPLKKVLFLDACHSGEVDKDEVEQIAMNTKSNGSIKFREAGAGIQKKNMGLKSTSELMGELFTDLRRGTGATVISSAGGVELAMESDQWKNGLFTYCLLHGLKDKSADENKDGIIMLSELQSFLRKEVTELSNGAQQPTSRIENLSMDFRVW